MLNTKKTISLIIPCYNEESNIVFSYTTITSYIQGDPVLSNFEYELVYIDDGSIDDTVGRIKSLTTQDSRVNLIEFSRNFGKEIALTAGIKYCTGDACICMDVDMQYPVEALELFVNEWAKGNEVVVGIRNKKNTKNIIEKWGSIVYYYIMHHISETKILSGALDYRLMDRKVINQFIKFTERGRTTRVLIDWLGFKRSYIKYKESPRIYGTPAFNIQKRTKLALDSFINNSLYPMTLIGVLGLIIFTLSSVSEITLIINLILGDPFNWAISYAVYLGLINTFLTSLILLSLFLVSRYIGNIQREVINRPLYIIKTNTLSPKRL